MPVTQLKGDCCDPKLRINALERPRTGVHPSRRQAGWPRPRGRPPGMARARGGLHRAGQGQLSKTQNDGSLASLRCLGARQTCAFESGYASSKLSTSGRVRSCLR